MFALRRGFAFAAGERVVLIEDVVTTGLSLREAHAAAQSAASAAGAVIVGAAALIDRGETPASFDFPFVSAAQLRLPSYAADAVPEALARIPVTVPGSRHL